MLSSEVFPLLVNKITWSSQNYIALVVAMTLPTVLINTFVQTKPELFVDMLSKIYIIGGFLIGFNRLPILCNRYILIISSLLYILLVISAMFYIIFFFNIFTILSVNLCTNTIAYFICLILSFFFCKRTRRYYNEINKFDVEVGCRPKMHPLSIKFYVQMCVVIAYIIVLFSLPYGITALPKLLIYVAPLHAGFTSELHYYGHLLSLLLPRLRLINYYMQISLNNAENVKTRITNKYTFFKNYNESSNCHMKKIMDVYYIIFQSYNYFIEAIKWQLLFIIITSFASVLGFCYHFSLHIISGERTANHLVSDLGLILVVMVPLFAPCVAGDKVHIEVRHLRELLASRLYENKLDKSSRSIARAMLEFTENWDLSFRLLRILDVDISLPFKFVGLLVTYIIILLQFEKVINP